MRTIGSPSAGYSVASLAVESAAAELQHRPEALRRAYPPASLRAGLLLARPSALFALDSVLVVSGAVVGYMARYSWRLGGIHDTILMIPPPVLALVGLIAVGVTLVELARSGAYRQRLTGPTLDGSLVVVRAATMAMGLAIVAGMAIQEQNISRLVYIYSWACIVGLVCAGRGLRTLVVAHAHQRGWGVRKVLVVGATPTGKMIMQNLASQTRRGYRLVGFVGEAGEAPRRFGRFVGLGTVMDLDTILVEHQIGEVIVALPAASHERIADILSRCERMGVAAKFVPDLFGLRLSHVRFDDVAGIPLIDGRGEKADALRLMLKRLLDVTVALLGLTLTAPLMAITALAIRLDSPGPILFRQERLGQNGQPFTILKFRSMHVDAERLLPLLRDQNESSGPIFKMRKDPRVTRVGRIIRKLSIDELPQLWNVLRKEMSLVGPRPPLASEVAQYDDWHQRRLDVTPGITCLWAVNGRSALEFDEMVTLDLFYIENWSLGLDLRILLRTALSLVRPSGAY